MKTKHAFFLRLIGSLFALVLLAAPSVGGAVIITSVDVIVGGASYCSFGFGCGNEIWNLGGGVNLSTGQTLILTQTGPVGSSQHGGENFDTSDRGGTLSGALLACSNPGTTPCTVQIFINGVLVVSDNGNTDPLTAFNNEPFSNTALDTLFQEDRVWQSAFTSAAFNLDLGYADNIHGGNCTNGVGCFPQAIWDITNENPGSPGFGAATYFFGAGIGPIGNCVINTFGGTTHSNTDSTGNVVGCYDGGALRITGTEQAAPEPSSLLLLGVALAGLGGLRRRRSA